VKALKWRPMALADRDAIMEHIADDNVPAALELDEDFETHAARASATPTLYKPGRMKGTREIVVRANYVMIYQVEGEAVAILRVQHATQQWPAADAKKRKSK
jgi:addiction module RelE/StbE family toxin